MTEATNRPTTPVSDGPADDSSGSYGSVSYLAIGGFLLAATYAVIMAVGVVIALVSRTPWILPFWSLAFPFGAAFLCWAARVRIHNSEGSLTGVKLTVWGLWLSLSFGLVYAAYYSACYLSITEQATTFTDGWFDNLKKDEIDLAFLKTLPPPRPAADDHLRDRLELDHDSGPEGRGEFTNFRQSPLVRQMEQGGTGDQVQLLGVQSWGYDQGGYQLELRYRVTTAAMSSEFVVTLSGVENADESGARQWYIKYQHQEGQPVLSDEGKRMTQLSNGAHTFAENWLKEIHSWKWARAYLDTLSPAERSEQEKNQDGEKYKAGLKAFRQGGLVHADPARFWAPPQVKDQIINGIRGAFGKDKDPDIFSLQPALPIYHRDGERVSFRFDVLILLRPEYGVQGQLLVSADSSNGEPGPDDWRIEALDLFSGKHLTPGSPGPGGSPTPMPAPPH